MARPRSYGSGPYGASLYGVWQTHDVGVRSAPGFEVHAGRVWVRPTGVLCELDLAAVLAGHMVDEPIGIEPCCDAWQPVRPMTWEACGHG